MSVLYLVFAIAMIVVAVAIAAFIWATRDGQFDDVDTPPIRMLLDDDEPHAAPPAKKHAADASTLDSPRDTDQRR